MSSRPQVISASRRTDVVANPALFDKLLSDLEAGETTYPHPRFALNRPPITKFCTVNLSPRSVIAISIWSKDFANFIAAIPARRELFSRYRWHFSFTINGDSELSTITTSCSGGEGIHFNLEPGVAHDVNARIAQLAAIADFCRANGQEPDKSIMVHIDPIVIWRPAGTGADRPVFDNLSHVPGLFSAMRDLGLTRVHFSFFQMFPRVKSRIRGLPVEIYPPTQREQGDLLRSRILPHALRNGISLQTCTALEIIKEIEGPIGRGACVSADDVYAIASSPEHRLAVDELEESSQRKTAAKRTQANMHCTCLPFRDVGDKSRACAHGCVYCFSNPEISW